MNLRKILASVLIIVGIICNSQAQDLLVYKNGDEQKVKVLEINTGDVKYKKWDNQQGPTYTVLKSELFMVKYQNGSKDVFKDETPAAPVLPSTPAVVIPVQPAPVDNSAAIEQQRRQENHDRNMALFRKKLGKGIGLTAAGGVLFVTGLPLFAWGVSGYTAFSGIDQYGYGYNTLPFEIGMVIGGAFTIASIPMLIVGPINLAKSFKYRKMAKSGMSLAFEPMFKPQRGQMPINMASGYSGGMTLKLKF